MDERFEKLQALLEAEGPDQIFADSVEATQANLHARGIDFSVEELKEFAKELEVQCGEEELDENSLDDVAGGVALLGPALAKWFITTHAPILLPKIAKWKR